MQVIRFNIIICFQNKHVRGTTTIISCFPNLFEVRTNV